MRTVSRLRLLLFSFYDYRCRAVHLFTCCPVESRSGPSERHLCFVKPLLGTQLNLLKQFGHNAVYFINILLVDLGGFAPPSRTLFSLLHTAITYSIYLFWLCVNLFDNWIAPGYYLFVLRSKFFLLLSPGLFAFLLSFVLGLFARLRHRS